MTSANRYAAITARNVAEVPQVAALPAAQREAIQVVSAVLPFRTNRYVVDELIDWSHVPDDPIFRLTFPQREMLHIDDYKAVRRLLLQDAEPAAFKDAVRAIQTRLNPHPAGQLEFNVPSLDGERLKGLQHKYPETVLLFPSQGQTCHAYCTYCFRWPQFVGLEEMRFATAEADGFTRYITAHREVTSVLFTGGDPMIMRSNVLARYVDPLLAADIGHVASIRFGSKALAYWPQRFVTDDDADDLLRLFERIVASGRSVAFMAHFSHPRELETPMVQQAIARVRGTGAVVRCQAPLVRQVNDDPKVWSDMWVRQVRLGLVPYYMFVERDTGPRHYFEVPLERAWRIYRGAVSNVSGLGRTVRGPSMSATPGKVVIDGVADVAGEQVFVLRFLQARDPAWVGRPFFAAFDARATWFDQLRPPSWDRGFFFEKQLHAMTRNARSGLRVIDGDRARA